jgi:hypothetical protein
MIRLKCQHCKYEYSISEEELRDNGELYKYCFVCGGIVDIINLEEIIRKDIDTEVKDNVDIWFLKLGIEYTLEMIERHKNLAVYRLYKTEIEKRGFKLK